MIRTGIFGGSYNPIHIGHLALANYLCEYGDLDELWFMVSPQNPFKANDTDLWDDDLRLELVRLATEEYPKFKASDFEFHLPRPSYMVNTLQKLREAHPDREFTLIIGEDNLDIFHKWREYQYILDNFRVFVYPRHNNHPTSETNQQRAHILREAKNIKLLTDAPFFDISSTELRKNLQD